MREFYEESKAWRALIDFLLIVLVFIFILALGAKIRGKVMYGEYPLLLVFIEVLSQLSTIIISATILVAMTFIIKTGRFAASIVVLGLYITRSYWEILDGARKVSLTHRWNGHFLFIDGSVTLVGMVQISIYVWVVGIALFSVAATYYAIRVNWKPRRREVENA